MNYLKPPCKSNEKCTCSELYLKAIPLSAQLVMWYWIHQEHRTKFDRNNPVIKQSANYIKRTRNKLKNINIKYASNVGYNIEKLTQLLRDTENWNN